MVFEGEREKEEKKGKRERGRERQKGKREGRRGRKEWGGREEGKEREKDRQTEPASFLSPGMRRSGHSIEGKLCIQGHTWALTPGTALHCLPRPMAAGF